MSRRINTGRIAFIPVTQEEFDAVMSHCSVAFYSLSILYVDSSAFDELEMLMDEGLMDMEYMDALMPILSERFYGETQICQLHVVREI